ncbi:MULTISPECIES: DHA2 family efflux MFS transporter permease subunit [unclassified Rathayibacter]|uniref:DHA2 family efflux MFS transporter permease subunit n=1 Tax=unclassified Rathayibacter TaxID=2609250 RepID=UPI00104ADDF8|nr:MULTISPECIES: DHA2 family efflux MFS transporter permease subunit [unclassified Rathayibacter]MCJ1703654.1 DHA2 family efflux MFS transporter permease subunit [Rathayibacter sp. VKM Ac-2926]TCL78319.1 EmrB/QacA subfamily drug resistance transporter [Rathayibacter sp. PhB192]TCM23922.1 EmrB/QacA subfamily drug resistance transporter [Rathayibacter sp. PhB179]
MSTPADTATSRPRAVLVVAILASFVAFLDGTVVNVALPAITRELGGGLAVQQWVVDGYLITLGALILVAGSLADRIGRARSMTIGLIGFGVTSLLCALAPTAEVLIVARMLQGAAGAILVPSSLALIIATVHGAAQAKTIGAWTAWTGTATIAGPVIGGLLVDAGSWRYVFALNLLPIAVTLLLLRRLGHVDSGTRVPIDGVGAVLGVIGLGGPVFALIEQERLGFGNPLVLVALIGGLAALVAFVLWERRTPNPMLPLSLFASRNFTVGNVSTAFVYGALSFGFFALGLYLQQGLGFSATLAGLATLPPTILLLLLSQVAGSLTARFGPRLFMGVGPLVAGVGFLLLAGVRPPADYATQLLPGILLFGLGLAITVAPLTSTILGAVDSRHSGVGSAINNAVSRIAGLVAIAATTLIVGDTLDAEGFRRAAIATAVLLFLGGLVSLLGICNPMRDAEPTAAR